MRACETCRYWERSEYNHIDGECHAHPPVEMAVGQDIVSRWPSAKRDDWCGEWARKTPDE